jgi:ABC-type amino acid transport system permease subunit
MPRRSFFWTWVFPALVSLVVALLVNAACYLAEIVRVLMLRPGG